MLKLLSGIAIIAFTTFCGYFFSKKYRQRKIFFAQFKEFNERFLNEIDSTSVYWNASTRFTDGGEFGLGCEIGISTQKLHARGPMGLCELTSYKYKIRGNGQIR